jgi:parvin
VQEVQAEGKYAIDSPGNPNNIEIPPEDYNLFDNEQRIGKYIIGILFSKLA